MNEQFEFSFMKDLKTPMELIELEVAQQSRTEFDAAFVKYIHEYLTRP